MLLLLLLYESTVDVDWMRTQIKNHQVSTTGERVCYSRELCEAKFDVEQINKAEAYQANQHSVHQTICWSTVSRTQH